MTLATRCALAALVVAALPQSVARAADPPDVKASCIKSYEGAQVQRQQSRLVEASQTLKLCARQECPSLVRIDCANWLADVEGALPSVIVKATIDGADASDVKVFIDGNEVTEHLDGKAIFVDPGPRKLRYEAPGFAPSESSVVIREGERYRSLTVAFESHKAPTSPVEMAHPVPISTWIFGGATVLATASFVVFGLAGNSRKSTLTGECAPFCSSSEASSVKQKYLLADVSLGVAVASLGLASFFYFTRPEVPVRVGLGLPTSSGFALRVDGQFQ